jgi:hypothetical protein
MFIFLKKTFNISHCIKIFHLAGSWWIMPIILVTQEAEIRRILIQGQSTQTVNETISPKYPTQKRTGGVTQVVECLPSNCENLNSNPSTIKKKIHLL